MNRKSRVGVLALSILLLAACGDDDSDTADSSDGSSATPTSSGAVEATGDPIPVGFINMEGGVVSLPEHRIATEVAVDHINGQLGGVNGRPIELVRCDTDGSPEKSIDCANQFVEADVVYVQEGVDLGIDAALPILEGAGIPVIGHEPFTPGAQSASNAFFLGAAFEATAVAPLAYYADQGMESVTFFFQENPASHAFTDDLLEPAADDLGLEYRTIYYDAAAPDWNVLAATALADNPDVIGSSSAPEQDCVGFVGALRSAGFQGPILAAVCSDFISTLGDQAVGTDIWDTVYRADVPSIVPDDKREDMDTYIDVMEAAGRADDMNVGTATFFSDTMNIWRILSDVDGPLDRAAVSAAMSATVDFESFIGPTISCDGSAWPGSTACGNSIIFYRVGDGGAIEPVGDGFIDVSEFATP